MSWACGQFVAVGREERVLAGRAGRARGWRVRAEAEKRPDLARDWPASVTGVGDAAVRLAESACGFGPGRVKCGCEARGGPIESP